MHGRVFGHAARRALIHAHALTEFFCCAIVLDWSSRRLERTCRSNLSAEAQSAANAVDTLELVKVYSSLLINPTQDVS